MLAVAKDEPLWAVVHGHWGQLRADAIAAQRAPEAWQQLSAGDGAKGPRLFDWVRLPLALPVGVTEDRRAALLDRHILGAARDVREEGIGNIRNEEADGRRSLVGESPRDLARLKVELANGLQDDLARLCTDVGRVIEHARHRGNRDADTPRHVLNRHDSPSHIHPPPLCCGGDCPFWYRFHLAVGSVVVGMK